MTVSARAYARAGLLGNPSDGYFGKTIAISIRNFFAYVELNESEQLEIEAQEQDRTVFCDMRDLVDSTRLYGYYGGVRLIKAAIKRFYEHCLEQDILLEQKNFKVSYRSDIPRQLGLGGSSAIITAMLRGLMQFYQVEIPQELQPSLILEAERDELGINAGFMDRVIQVYEGCVFMDLDQRDIKTKGYGSYAALEPCGLSHLYLAYKPSLGKVSGQVLNDIRVKYDQGDQFVISILNRIAELAEIGKQVLKQGDVKRLHELMDENFDLRSRIMKISDSNFEMITTARRCGAAAKYAGSGGTIIGVYHGEDMYLELQSALEKIGVKVLKPDI